MNVFFKTYDGKLLNLVTIDEFTYHCDLYTFYSACLYNVQDNSAYALYYIVM